MSPPKRRSQTRQSHTPSPAPERKPKREDLLIEESGEPEKFNFSFAPEGLTAEECAEKMETFKTKEEFLETVHIEEALRFISKVLLGRKGQPLKCMLCDRVYASSGGYWFHWQKCNVAVESSVISNIEKYRNAPILWLKVQEKDQEAVLREIVGDDPKCFSYGCNKKFKTLQNLVKHLDTCVRGGYATFADRPGEFRKLSSKLKNAYIREAMATNEGSLGCFLCDRKYVHPHGLIYHIDRCGVEESIQPWKCYRCGHEATRGEADAHLLDCSKKTETKVFEAKFEACLSSLFGNGSNATEEPSEPSTSAPSKRRRTTGGAPRATARKDGTTLLRFRKSTVNRQFNGIVSEKDQKSYEATCQDVFNTWKADSDGVAFVNRLEHVPISEWETRSLDENDKFYRIFNRESVTITTEKLEGLQASVPVGNRIKSRNSLVLDQATIAYCGAPINGIQVAPGTATNGDDVICVTTFANETNFESDSSVVQFWRHRVSSKMQSELDLWFLLHVPEHGTILSMTWLQKFDTSDPGLIGYVAFSTTIGPVLIYRIDSTSVAFDPEASSSADVLVVSPEPHLILSLPKSSESADDTFLNATIKVEGEEIILPVRIDESAVPLTKISWSAHGGGGVLAAITALGAIAIWNLDRDLSSPRVHIDDSWQSPPTDISFLNFDHLVIGFKEKLVKVVNIDSWEVKLEDNTVKTAGTKVHADSRVVHSFFTYNSDHNQFPAPYTTSVSYINMDMDSMNIILIPTGNSHQLMVWDVAMCAPLGTLISCGVDGRLVASATGRLLRDINHPFFANRNLMSLKRRRIMKADMKTPKSEENESAEKQKEALEESIVEHSEVCRKMWLEVGFDQVVEPARVELSCRDQRIESLNCVDANTNVEFPVSFTGGEAGLLFAVPSKLLIQKLDL